MELEAATLVEKATRSSRRWLGCFALACLALLPLASAAPDLTISKAEAEKIGRRIWQNECGGTIAGLTSWNSGENFASLGIGHFIWYPKNQRGPFDESFPKLLGFMDAHGAKLPEFLAHSPACPWNSRVEFQQAQDSVTMKELRQFLGQTVDLQAQFLVTRLRDSLAKMGAAAAASDREKIERQFGRVSATAQGCYALVDYVNFKGEGTLASERYHGQGWGLLQVLQEMTDSHSALDEFANSAKTVLRRRVVNSPPARGEARWLNGWLARVESYRRS